MNRFNSTPPEERTQAPFANLTPEDLVANVGRVIAVDSNGGGIIEMEDTVRDLRDLMNLKHPNHAYRTLLVSNLSGVVDNEG